MSTLCVRWLQVRGFFERGLTLDGISAEPVVQVVGAGATDFGNRCHRGAGVLRQAEDVQAERSRDRALASSSL